MKKFTAIGVIAMFFAYTQGIAFGQVSEQEPTTGVIYPTSFAITQPVNELVKQHPYEGMPEGKVWVSPDRKNRPHQTFIYSRADGPQFGNDSAIIQTSMGTRSGGNKAILQSWAGITSSAFPPDPTGAVGPNHYIQIVNATTVRIFNKTGTALSSFSLGTLWGLGTNAGDPIVMYDKFADRWFLSQFGSSNQIYIAISQTNDPTGSYYVWTYVSPQFPDYLKFSIWQDGYYMTSNQATDKVYVFERSVMLTGGAGARGIYSTFTTGSVSDFYVPLPADAADDEALPAAGTPLPFFSYYDNAWGGGTDGIKIWNMTTNWTTGTASITGPTQVNTSEFDASYDASWDDVPQPNGQPLDGIGGVLMYRAPWRSWSGYNSMVLSWGILISDAPRQRAIYWCELRQIAGVWSMYQQGIYAPDTDTRWMSSAAMDDNGSIALCYAKSSASAGDYPSLYYTGRLAGDPLGTMTFAETLAKAGSGSQSTYNRFGDYAQTSLDTDGITFWHTGEYVASTTNQETWIYSFQLPNVPLAPVANFIADATAPFCTGTVQFTDQSTNLPTSWLWNFGDGQTSTAQNPSHTYTANGAYTVVLTATNAQGSDVETKTSYVTINMSLPPTATGAARCGTGTLVLNAVGNNTLHWYDAATGGNDLGTGTSYTTPSISATTTYYVANVISQASQYVGPAVAGAANTTTSYLIFDCTSPVVLVSVAVNNGGTAGNRTIQLQNSAGTVLKTTTVTVPAGASRITLNWDIPVGTSMRLVTPANSSFFRKTSGVAYPYTLAGLLSITGCSAGATRYTSYFDWEVQEPSCSSTRVPVVATVTPAVTPAVSISASASSICSGTSVTFTASPTNGGTPSYQWKLNGTNTGNNSPTFTSSALANGDVVTCVMTSTASCASPTTATSTGITMSVSAPVTPSVTVAASATTICAGTSVTFTPTPTNGGAPSYQWKVNGSNVATGATYTSSTLAQGDVVTCVMTSTATCATPSTATSSPITMTVNAAVTPAVSVSASATSICSGNSVTFTPTPTNGGTPSYQWKVNGSNVATGATYTSSTLANGDVVTCVMTSTATCASPVTATSSPISITVTSSVVPSVSVAASATTICSGNSVTFTPTPINGGTPSYQWKVNGSNVSTGGTYTSSTLANGDVVTCVMTSTASCASPTTATSAPVNMIVNAVVTPAVSISASATTICSGTSVTFTPSPTNGGTPAYQWKVNGSNVSTGGTYTSSTLANGDVVTCVMTSTASCASPSTATSAPVNMTVNATVVPSVSVSASNTSICTGDNVSFSATPTNGGTPSYQWKVNGSNVGTGSTYNSSTLANGDIVTCVMTSTATCASPLTATSSPISITVSATPVPALSVSASATTICSGTSVTFTPNPTNGGTPSYQWKLNGTNVGTGSTYVSSGLANGDVITCVMTSSLSCAAPTTATSLPVTMTVNANVTPAVSVSASATTICSGTSVTFTPNPTNGGTPSYQWKLNGSNVGTGSTYSSSSLAQGDQVTCVMTSTASCAAPATATSLPITMTVNSTVVPAVSVAASATTICSGSNITFNATPTNGGTPSYQWKVNGSNVGTGSSYSSNGLLNGDVVTCVMTSTATCAAPATATSTPIAITVNTSVTPAVLISASATTICSNTSVTFTASPTNGGTPSYQWVVNGSNVGGNSPTYTTTSLQNGDVVSCVMTSTALCATSSSVNSNVINMVVSASVTPVIDIVASANNICSGTSVTFNATPTNGGTPMYQWKLNGSDVGTNTPSYTNSALVNGDIVSCSMTSTASCASPASVSSNSIGMIVNSIVVPAVSISSVPAGPICPGISKTFTANPTFGGSPSYEWFVDGLAAGTGPTLTGVYTNGQVITCTMTSTESCAMPATADAMPITISVYSVTPVSISDNAGVLTSSATSGNQWYEQSSGIINGETGQTFEPYATGDYYVIVTDANGCESTSNIISVVIDAIGSSSQTVFSFYPNPTIGNLTITFGRSIENGTIILENALGQVVFEESITQEAGSTKIIDFSIYAPGAYFVSIKDINTDIREKVVYSK